MEGERGLEFGFELLLVGEHASTARRRRETPGRLRAFGPLLQALSSGMGIALAPLCSQRIGEVRLIRHHRRAAETGCVC